MKHPYSILYLFILGFFGIGVAQVETSSELYKTFQKKDSLLFDVGFNNCDLTTLATQLTEDLEFYHDQGGFQDKMQFLKAMEDNICSSPNRKPIRKLTPNTMKVFPLYDQGKLYGAIVEGKHEFYIKEPDKELFKTGSALFSGLWILQGETWKIKRIYSYHHQPE
jgi:hypothetical protein